MRAEVFVPDLLESGRLAATDELRQSKARHGTALVFQLLSCSDDLFGGEFCWAHGVSPLCVRCYDLLYHYMDEQTNKLMNKQTNLFSLGNLCSLRKLCKLHNIHKREDGL
ncbi:hypothetical protein D3C72_1891140 [compost metagenome]